ncbi:MAG: IS110 family transposase [Selenomonadaceae bacterium]|nr:IS110 family transposase [Selenomonadaceae bacterium]
MILVGIDVAKDKHDCFIQIANGKVLFKAFSFANNYEGFEELYAKILSCNDSEIRIGLESTGHYSYNLLGFLLSKELPTFLFNPLQTNQFRKGLSLRKTKTDKVDAKTIALMLATESDENAYSLQAYQNEELKSLTRYRADKVSQRSKLKQSLSRLVTILFPELESAVSTVHSNSIYAMLLKYPSAKDVAKSQFHSLVNLLESTSRGKIDKDKAKEIRNLARKSVGVYVSTKVLELRHTIKLIQILDEEVAEIEKRIQNHMQELHSPIESIPGISTRLAAVIESEVGDFQRFSSPDKILAFAGLSPTTYQSGKYTSQNATMEKRGSRYLRCALFLAAHLVSRYSKTFAAYLKKKRDEGKHYFVALSHVAKKLVRVIFHLQRTGESFSDFA